MAVDITQSHYSTGTATVSGAAVTGSGTAWVGAIRAGDLYGTHRGSGVRILSVNDNASITLAYALPELEQTDAPYEIQRTPFDVGYLAAIEDLIRKYGAGNLPDIAVLTGQGIVEFQPGGGSVLLDRNDLMSGVQFDVQVPDLAGRAAYDGQVAGYAVLVNDIGDGRSAVYSKQSDAAGDWSGPAYLTGAVGPTPEVEATVSISAPGTPATVDEVPIAGGVRLDFTLPGAEGFNFIPDGYDPLATYVKGNVVQSNGSSWILTAENSTGNAPPDAASPVQRFLVSSG